MEWAGVLLLGGVREGSVGFSALLEDAVSAGSTLLAEAVLPGLGEASCSAVGAWRAIGLSSAVHAGHVIDLAPPGVDVGVGEGEGAPLRLVCSPHSVHHAPLLWGLVAAAVTGAAWRLRRGPQ